MGSDLCIWRERTRRTLDDSRKVSQPLLGRGRKGRMERNKSMNATFRGKVELVLL